MSSSSRHKILIILSDVDKFELLWNTYVKLLGLVDNCGISKFPRFIQFAKYEGKVRLVLLGGLLSVFYSI